MSIAAVSRSSGELDELFELHSSRLEVLRQVRALRDQRKELMQSVAIVDRDLEKLEEPLRRVLAELRAERPALR